MKIPFFFYHKRLSQMIYFFFSFFSFFLRSFFFLSTFLSYPHIGQKVPKMEEEVWTRSNHMVGRISVVHIPVGDPKTSSWRTEASSNEIIRSNMLLKIMYMLESPIKQTNKQTQLTHFFWPKMLISMKNSKTSLILGF